VYDVLGREVATLVDEFQQAGHKSVSFDAAKLASGVYFARVIATDDLRQIRFSKGVKLVIVR
jgi:hypothetical protein